jgi:hypothetical protein
MRLPLAKFKAPSAAPAGAPPPRSCPNCSAPFSVGQDWCLECGTAAPGRFGRGPGLRSSLGVVGVTLLLVIGAVAAAYAALSSDSRQATQTTASVPAQVPGAPDVAAVAGAPAAAPAPTAPATAGAPTVITPPVGAPTTLPATPKLPGATPTPTPTAKVTPPPATTKAAPTTPTTTVTKPKTTTTPSAPAPAAKSAKILLDTDAATTYNPYSLAPGGFGDPAKAIDGDAQSAWTYQLDPATAGKTLVGLAINLKSPQKVRSLTIATPSPGMTVEFYGATGAEPVSITDPAWRHLANRRQLAASSTVTLKTGGRALDYLLVWITHAPAGATTGSLGVSELSVTT